MTKPIRVFNGGFTGRIWATRNYRETRHGEWVGYTASTKDDVTDEALAAVIGHIQSSEQLTAEHSATCLCRALSLDSSLATVLLRNMVSGSAGAAVQP